MRQYRYEATEETIEALRLLRGAWSGIRVEPARVTVRLADAREVRLGVESADPEPKFEAFRISAAVGGVDDAPIAPPRATSAPFRDAADFAVGRNDVVVFAGATWIEGEPAADADLETDRARTDAGGVDARRPLGRDSVLQFSGHPGQISGSAVAVCLTTDAVVIATPVGTGFLVRTGLKPYSLDVTDDPAALDQFLRERSYRSSANDG